MITDLSQMRVEATTLVVGAVTETRVEIFTSGHTELPVISLTRFEALILARRLKRAAR